MWGNVVHSEDNEVLDNNTEANDGKDELSWLSERSISDGHDQGALEVILGP